MHIPNIRTLASVVACGIAIGACTQTKPAEQKAETKTPAAPWVTVQPLELPVTTPAGMPQLTRAGRGVTLSWVDNSDDAASLRFAEWTGDKWSAVSTAAKGKDWFQSWADVPSVTRLSSGALVANWFVNTGAATAADMLELIRIARARVEEVHGVRLELEWKVIGDD